MGYLHPSVESEMAWDASPVLPARLHTMDRALPVSQPRASVHEQSDCPLLSWVVKDGYLATRKPGCKRASGANGMERFRTRSIRSRLEPLPDRTGYSG